MEIYNENIYDLLSPAGAAAEPLKIRIAETEGTNYVEGLTECLVSICQTRT